MKMHSNFSKLIAAFKQELDSFDIFVGIVSFFFHELHVHIFIAPLFLDGPCCRRSKSTRYQQSTLQDSKLYPPGVSNGICDAANHQGEKSGCGFSHLVTTKLLCPLRYLDHLQADPMYVHISISTGNFSPHLLLASSKMKLKTECSNFVRVMKETGPCFSIPKTHHIMNWS